ncbi:MAG TPA: amidohydrolase family protein, partial [Anaerolineaceae bacterium]
MSIDLLLKNARLVGSAGLTDLAVDGGRIAACQPGLQVPARVELDARGGLVSPGFVEPHLHLDIALSNPPERAGRERPFRSPAELNQAMEARRKADSPRQIAERAYAALELASRHGVTAVRAQCQVDPEVGLTHLLALVEAREKASAIIDLQIVAFPQQGLLGPGRRELFFEAFRQGADVMGCAPNREPNPGSPADFRRHIDTALEWAGELQVDLDAHADLGLPDTVSLDGLESVYLARRAVQTGFQGRVTAGHLCALDSALPEIQAEAAEII